MTAVLCFLCSFAVSAGLLPFVIRIARSRNLYDEPGERKVHTKKIPRLGGLGIVAGAIAGMVGAYFSAILVSRASFHIAPSAFVVFGGALVCALLGFVDDIKGLRAWTKFVVQAVVALAVIGAGYRFRVIEIPVVPYSVHLGILGPPITWIWIIGIINAVNLIDGLDGLAGGVALIGVGIWATLYLRSSIVLPAYMAIAVTGGIVGFLFFNFPPASIFMGDSGSLFLGFTLAVLPLMRVETNPGRTGLIAAITICFIPILDTIAAIWRRVRRGVSIFSADKEHLHHRLLARRLEVREILALIYAACAALGAVVIITELARPVAGFYLALLSWIVCSIAYILVGVPPCDREHY